MPPENDRPFDLSQFHELFLVETTERLDRINQLVLSLEIDPANRELIDTLLRELHSVKGMASSMGYVQFKDLAHALESLIDPCRQSGILAVNLINLILSGLDRLQEQLDDIAQRRSVRVIDLSPFTAGVSTASPHDELQPLPAAPAPSPTSPSSVENKSKTEDLPSAPQRNEEQTVRIRSELLDQLINLTGELVTNHFSLQSARKDENWNDLDSHLDLLKRVIGNLHHSVMQARVIPFERVTARLPRLVRDLCRQTGKEIKLIIEGNHLEIDRSICDHLVDPLIHLVRNAVDHGIENHGTIVIRALREGRMASIMVSDDGKGLDPEHLYSIARAKGYMTNVQARPDERELLQLICLPGFSTARSVSDLSGRGVGMDIVQKSINSLGGDLTVRSAPGAGTTFYLKVPLTTFIIRILLVSCAGEIVGLPISRILHVQQITPEEESSSSLENGIVDQHLVQQFLPLEELLQLPEHEEFREGAWIALFEENARTIGLIFDDVIDQREVYVKPVSPPMDQFSGLSGSTILGDGRVVYIIDPALLMKKLLPRQTALSPEVGETSSPSPTSDLSQPVSAA